MSNNHQPRVPSPPPLKGIELGSFAHHTVVRRLPDIGRRVIAENDFPANIVSRLKAFIAEIPDSPIKPLSDESAPDSKEWQIAITPNQEKNWLQVPWFFAETYFYRRILETTGYFGSGRHRQVDPYTHQKRLGLETTREAIRMLSDQLGGWLGKGWDPSIGNRLLSIDLWGNQVDLSIWPAGEEGQPSHSDMMEQQAHVLVDDTAAIIDRLSDADRPLRLDFLVDNAGFELICDLCLVDYLLYTRADSTIQMNLKLHPTFVSDATIEDVMETISFLEREQDTAVNSLGKRLRLHLENGRLLLWQHSFWTSPLPAWEMPPDLRRDLAHSHLVISKGDANYRRLLGDRHWPFTTPFTDVVSYFPAPIVALRTFKSEVAIGLESTQLEALDQDDPGWMTNGNWGVIQYSMSHGRASQERPGRS